MNFKNAFSTRALNRVSTVWDVFEHIDILELNNTRRTIGLGNIVDLSIGDPCFKMNSVIIEKLKSRLNNETILDSFSCYSPVSGRPQTLEAIRKLYTKYYPNVNFQFTHFMCTNGANQAIWNALSTFVDIDDEVLVFEPYFVNYEPQVLSLGGKIIKCSTRTEDFGPDLVQLKQLLKSAQKLKVIILNYPNNPSGFILKREVLEDIAQILIQYPNLIIIIDDVYRDLNYKAHLTILDVRPELLARTIIINSCSKGLLSAPDLRIGMVGAPKAIIKAMSQQQLLSTASVSLLSQYILIDAIETKLNGESEEWEKARMAHYQQNFVSLVEAFPHVCSVIELSAGFFVLLNMEQLINLTIPENLHIKDLNGKPYVLNNLSQILGFKRITSDIELALYMLFVAGVILVPGSKFGISASRGYLRISCAKEREGFMIAVNCLKQAYDALYVSLNSILVE